MMKVDNCRIEKVSIINSWAVALCVSIGTPDRKQHAAQALSYTVASGNSKIRHH